MLKLTIKYTHGRTVYKRYIIKALPIFFNREFYKNTYIEELENKFKEFIGIKYAIATSSARFAIHLIFKCLDFEKGKTEIIIPAYMPRIVAGALKAIGLKLVFVDIDPRNLNIDSNKIEEKITKNTKYILIVHLNGIPCDIDNITKIAKKYNLFLIEDSAQAFNATYKGKKVGSFGYASVISFSKFKNFNTCGGGMVLTNDKILNDKIRKEIEKLPHPGRLKTCKFIYDALIDSILRTNTIHRFIYLPIMNFSIKIGLMNRKKLLKIIFRGRNSGHIKSVLNIEEFYRVFGLKYTNLQAKMGLSEFSDSKFWKRIKQNDDNVNMLHEKIGATTFLTKDIEPCYFFCFIQIKNPKKIYEQLAKEKIQTNYFRYPNLIQEKILGDQKKQYPIVEKTITNMLYLPFRHPLKQRDIKKIIEKLKKFNPEIIKY